MSIVSDSLPVQKRLDSGEQFNWLVLEFFLAPEHDPYSSWFMASIRISDLDELYAAVRASGVPEEAVGIPRLVPVALREWGQRAGYLIDVDGTQLHLIEEVG